MKNLLLFITFMLPVVMGCQHSKPAAGESWSVRVDSTSAHQRAWVMCDEGAPMEDCIALQKKAVADLEARQSQDDPVEVLAQMGLFYNYVGDYRNGIEYLQKAEKYLEEHPEYELGEGTIQLYGDMGDLYRILGMIPESRSAFRKGIAISHQLGGRLLSDLYCFMAATYEDYPDSVLYCYDMALKAIDDGGARANREKLRQRVLSERADYMVMSGLWKDSIDACVRTLEELNDSDAWMPAIKEAQLGCAYVTQGQTAKGIGLLENAIAEIRESGDIDTEIQYLDPLMEAYAKNGYSDRLLKEFFRYDQLRDTVLDHEKLLTVIGSDMRYQTSRVRAENEMFEMKMTIVKQRIVYGIIIAAIIIATIVLYFILKRRNYHKMLGEKTMRINTLLEDHIALNSKIELLNAQVADRHAAEERLQLQPILLEKEHEEEFRKTFNELHPNFIDGLRRDFNGITPGQEIICMLIYLFKTNEEIALALGISRESVVKSRYRIRRRFNLDTEDDLDTFIRNR